MGGEYKCPREDAEYFVYHVREAAAESTCQKRITVCVILDAEENILACESNRCDPPDGVCERLGVREQKENYTGYTCNVVHAEIRAVAALPVGSKPIKAFLFGHDFICSPCEKNLRRVGIKAFVIVPSAHDTGLRQ